MADREIDRLVTIVENLLAAGRLQAGVLTVDLGDTEPSAIVEAVIAALDAEQRARVDTSWPPIRHW